MLRGVPGAEPCNVCAQAGFCRAGWLDEDGEIWDCAATSLPSCASWRRCLPFEARLKRVCSAVSDCFVGQLADVGLAGRRVAIQR